MRSYAGDRIERELQPSKPEETGHQQSPGRGLGDRTAPTADSRPGRVRRGYGIDHLGHAGQPFLLAGGAPAARPGPTSSCVGTLPAGAPPRLLGRAAVAAKCRFLTRLLDCHGADPAHGAVDGPSHLDRGTHARPYAPRLRGLHAPSPVPDRSGRVVNAARRSLLLSLRLALGQ